MENILNLNNQMVNIPTYVAECVLRDVRVLCLPPVRPMGGRTRQPRLPAGVGYLRETQKESVRGGEQSEEATHGDTRLSLRHRQTAERVQSGEGESHQADQQGPIECLI